MNKNSLLRPSLRLVATARDERRDRREARMSRRALERELSAYSTPADINDLLGTMSGQDGADADNIREILVRNQLRQSLHRAS
jgi:hypothetical protein